MSSTTDQEVIQHIQTLGWKIEQEQTYSTLNSWAVFLPPEQIQEANPFTVQNTTPYKLETYYKLYYARNGKRNAPHKITLAIYHRRITGSDRRSGGSTKHIVWESSTTNLKATKDAITQLTQHICLDTETLETYTHLILPENYLQNILKILSALQN